MPVAAFDSLTTVLNAARVRMNDELKSLAPTGGQLIGNNSAFSQQATNTAWRKFQEALANLGYTGLKPKAIISALPVVATQDPALSAWIDWANYFDGVNLWPAPVLPEDLISPLQLLERPSGQNALFVPMELMIDGLPNYPKQGWNRCWEWRDQRILIPGSQFIMDLQVEYIKFLPDFMDIGTTRWFNQPVPIARCLDAFSYYICAEVVNDFVENASGLSEMFAAKGVSAMDLVMNRDIKLKQRVNVRRVPRSGRGQSNLGYGW